MSDELRRLYGIPADVNGVVVTSVKNVSPAGEANINVGDVISEVQGEKTQTLAQFRAAIDKIRSGQRFRMYVSTPTRGGDVISTYRILRAP